jgi:hypothetical protein
MYQKYYEAGYDIDSLDLEVLNGEVKSLIPFFLEIN